MGTTLFASCSFPWRCNQQQIVPSSQLLVHSSQESGISRIKATAEPRESGFLDGENEKFSGFSKRRSVLVSSAVLGFPGEGLAVVKQGLLAGRIPGLSEPYEQGWRTYCRPDSGGHGVGWSPIIPYAFSVPELGGGNDHLWEVPVSIADLGGTERDLRFASSKEGRLFVIVAPVLRFADNLGVDAMIELVGPPEKVINAFDPEVIGENVEGKVLSMNVAVHSGKMYYRYELEPTHVLITATAAGNRFYLFSITGSRAPVEETLQRFVKNC